MNRKKIIRITTIPGSLTTLLKGQLKFISGHFDVIAISSKGRKNQLEELFANEGVRHIILELTRKITPIKDFIAVFRLYKILKKEKPYILHSHTPKAGTVGMIAARLANVPHRLHTVAGLPLVEAKGIKRKVLSYVEKITYSCATRVYPNSYGLKEFILNERFTKESKVKVIANGSSNGIDTEYFNSDLYDKESREILKQKLKIHKEDFVFIFVGRLVKDKGLNELIEAFSKLNKHIVNAKLLLVGGYEKELDPLLPKTIKAIQTNVNIISTGWVDDVRQYFSISNVLTFPSYREGFPNVVMQASSMGLASIVTDINGCNEIIEHQQSGLIIPKKDTRSLYNAMEFTFQNKGILRDMGVKSRKNMIEKYEQKVVWKAILNEYNEL